MKNSIKRLFCIFAVVCLLTSCFIGCGENTAASSVVQSSDVPQETTTSQETTASQDTSSPSGVDTANESAVESVEDTITMPTSEGLQEVELPLTNDNPTISFWVPYPFFIGNMIEDMSTDVVVLSELQKRTGINFDITAINGENETEQFNLMIASGSYCDVITDMSRYSKGYDAAFEEGIIIDLYDLAQTYAPNYWYYLTSDKDTMSVLVTDEGKLPTIATLYKTAGCENMGYTIRYDWLEALGMSVPKTYDELEAYAEACNNTYGTKGLYYNASGLDALFAFGYDCGTDFIVHDGQVTHAFLQDSFRAYLEKAADWYARGLIFSDFYQYGMDDTIDQMYVAGELASNICSCSGYNRLNIYKDENYEATFGPMQPVRINESDEIHFSTTVGTLIKKADTWSITESCDNPELVMGIVNYLFSEDGQLLFNWGIEGDSFTFDADGNPQYTDKMINNPDQPYLFNAYLYASHTSTEYAPSVMDVSKQYYAADELAWEAYDLYLDDGADRSYNYPSGATLNSEEMVEYATISSDISTYVDTQILMFVTGQTAITDETWGQFQDSLRAFGIETIIDYKQAAYDRYEKKLEMLFAE